MKRFLQMNVWVKSSLLFLVGGSLGFAYYYYIGCVSGTCPITSNPYISTAYGAVLGLLAGSDSWLPTKRKKEK